MASGERRGGMARPCVTASKIGASSAGIGKKNYIRRRRLCVTPSYRIERRQSLEIIKRNDRRGVVAFGGGAAAPRRRVMIAEAIKPRRGGREANNSWPAAWRNGVIGVSEFNKAAPSLIHSSNVR